MSRAIAKRILHGVRSALSLQPAFVVTGGAKVGKSFLWSCLSQQPGLCLPTRSEPHYFSRRYAQGTGWYRRQFPLLVRSLEPAWVPKRRITGESSASYLMAPHAASRLYSFSREMRLVFLLRDPVLRAKSHYDRLFAQRRMPLTFEQCIERELESPWTHESLWKKFGLETRTAYEFPIFQGYYADHLEPWLNLFDDDQFLIVFAEDLFSDPNSVIERICRHLGLPRSVSVNVPTVGATSPEMKMNEAQSLRDHYRPHDERLADVLGRSLPWT